MALKRVLFGVLAAAAVLCFGCPAVFAEGENRDSGDKVIHRYHYYYIPYQPGAVNCYGVYRVLGNYTNQALDVEAGDNYRQIKDFADNKIVKFTQKSAFYSSYNDITRGDLFVFTDFLAQAQRTDVHSNGSATVYDHYYFYYETPLAVVGETIVTSPLFGVETVDNQTRTIIAVDRNLMKKYSSGLSDSDLIKVILPQFDGANPRGSLVRNKWLDSTHEVGIFSLSKDHDAGVGWWDLFSQAVLKHIDDIRKNPKDYFRRPTADDLKGLQETKQYIESQSKQNGEDATRSLLMAVNWNSITSAQTMDSLLRYVYKNYAKSVDGSLWAYYFTDFLDEAKVSNLWERGAKKIADSVWNKAGIRDVLYGGEEVPPVSIGKTFGGYKAKPAQPSKDYYLGTPQDILVNAPWGTDATDYLVPHHLGFWSAREPYNKYNFSNDFIFISCDPAYVGRWLWQKAQYMLYEQNKSKWMTRSKTDGKVWGALAGNDADRMFAVLTGIKGKNAFVWTEPYSPMGNNPQEKIWHSIYNIDRGLWKAMFPYMSLKFHPVFASMFKQVPGGYLSWKTALQRSYAPQVISSWDSDLSVKKPSVGMDEKRMKEISRSGISSLMGADGNKYISAFKDSVSKNGFSEAFKTTKVTFAGRNRITLASQADLLIVPSDGGKAMNWFLNQWPLRSLFTQKILATPDLSQHKQMVWQHWDVSNDIKSGSGISNW